MNLCESNSTSKDLPRIFPFILIFEGILSKGILILM